jgi:hypothetical protein
MHPCLSLALSAVLAGGQTYHVAADDARAADTNPGTADAPWQTLAPAADVLPGSTVYLHAGRYPENLRLNHAGTAEAPIVVAAWQDDEVLLDGADPYPADRWTLVDGFTKVYATPLDRDPGQVFVDDAPLPPKVEKLAPDNWRLAPIGDDDAGLWQFDPEGKRLLLNVGGGNPGEGRRVDIPVRLSAVVLNAHCRLRGIHARRYAGTAIDLAGDDAVVEDCDVRRCANGIRVAGWDRRGCIVRRNTVVECLANGIFLQDRPTHTLVEDNLVVRCTLNPWHAVLWSGSIKMNSAADSVFAHNVVLEAGNPATINGWDGWALWGDINIVRVMYLGNATAHNKEAGLYLEYAMADTRAYFNASYRDGHGITCRQSQRGVFMRNLVESARSSGLAVWGGAEPYPTADHVFAHNLVRNCAPSLRLQLEQPQLVDYNTYLPRDGAPFADGEAGRKFDTIDQVREATGHELHGEVRDAQPEEVGLGRVTFRVPDATAPDEVLGMIANGGAEYDDPAGVNLLPYFWHAAAGDGSERTFVYAAYTGLPGGIDTFAYGGAGGTVGLRGGDESAHSGHRCLEVNGFHPDRIPPEGLGFRSPTLPARPGDVVEVRLFVKGKDLAPVDGSALAGSAEFTNSTGQHRQRIDLLPDAPVLSGTFDWRELTGAVRVPAEAARVSYFIGLQPATGTVWLDDVELRVR